MREKFARLGVVNRSSLDSKLVAIINNMLPKLDKDKILLQGLVNTVSPNETLIWTNTSLGQFFIEISLTESLESAFGTLKFHSLRLRQATLKSKTLVTMTMSSVNHTDQWLEGSCEKISADERLELIRKRMKEDEMFEHSLLLKVFGEIPTDLIKD